MNISAIQARYEAHDQSLYGGENVRDSIGLLYHENSKLDTLTAREQGMNIAYFNDPYVIRRSTLPYKVYPGKARIEMSDLPRDMPKTPVLDAINGRRSLRSFDSEYSVSLNELSILLHSAYGVSRWQELEDGGSMGFRNVPSGGGLYPLELYVVLFRGHVSSGLYHYQSRDNALELIKEGDFLPEMRRLISAEPWINLPEANGVILMTGLIERLGIKYGERSYRFLQQETGFVTYLLSLVAHHIGLGTCIAGMYLDDELNDFIGVDGVFEAVQGTMVFGKRQTTHE